jgi:EAL domain-containing protein (putative c-di-GMP-specific phosphodiesterase class I)
VTVSRVGVARPLLEEINRIIDAAAVRAVFQPIVELDGGRVVGYEALARGPEESPLEAPTLLFEAARKCGRAAELDWICRAAAARAALDAGLGAPLTLFVNVEPDALNKAVPHDLKPVWLEAQSSLKIVLEVTESALTAQPTELLWGIEWARELGWGIALDDVGGDARSLALLPFLRPDVVKLDLGLVRGSAGHVATMTSALVAHCERTGAALLAEGVESEADLDRARALGATLAQGWLFGHPRRLPAQLPQPGAAVTVDERHWHVPAGRTPFQIMAERRRVHSGTKRVLEATSRTIETCAVGFAESVVLLGAFQDERFFGARVAARYERIASRAAFVAVLGSGMSPSPAPGVRGSALLARDPLRGEWVVAIVSPHFAAALAARDLGDEVSDRERRFDFALTYERELVMRVALSLMARVLAA